MKEKLIEVRHLIKGYEHKIPQIITVFLWVFTFAVWLYISNSIENNIMSIVLTVLSTLLLMVFYEKLKKVFTVDKLTRSGKILLKVSDWVARCNPTESEMLKVKTICIACSSYIFIRIPYKYSLHLTKEGFVAPWLEPFLKGDYVLLTVNKLAEGIVLTLHTKNRRFSRNYSIYEDFTPCSIRTAIDFIKRDLNAFIEGFNIESTWKWQNLYIEATIPDIKAILEENTTSPLIIEFREVLGEDVKNISRESIHSNYYVKFSDKFCYHITTAGLYKVPVPKIIKYRPSEDTSNEIFKINRSYFVEIINKIGKTWCGDEDGITGIVKEISTHYSFQEWAMIWSILSNNKGVFPRRIHVFVNEANNLKYFKNIEKAQKYVEEISWEAIRNKNKSVISLEFNMLTQSCLTSDCE